MFSHVMLGVNDLEISKKFYDAVLGTIGIGPGAENNNRYFYASPAGVFAITTPINGEPATFGNGATIGFMVESPEQGDAFHAAGVVSGGPLAKIRRECGTAVSTWPTCVTLTATNSARCTDPAKGPFRRGPV